jgi:hypothetical protein
MKGVKMATSDSFPQTQDSSSSSPTAVSIHSETILELGKKIVTELGLDESVDTLGRWMAHYVAEVIRASETAQPEERQAKLAQCTIAILQLWKHRNDLPHGSRPFEGFELALRALGEPRSE